jgi:hypothetical protein
MDKLAARQLVLLLACVLAVTGLLARVFVVGALTPNEVLVGLFAEGAVAAGAVVILGRRARRRNAGASSTPMDDVTRRRQIRTIRLFKTYAILLAIGLVIIVHDYGRGPILLLTGLVAGNLLLNYFVIWTVIRLQRRLDDTAPTPG